MTELSVPLTNGSPGPVRAEAPGEFDQAVENWLRNEVVPAYKAWKADPNAVSYTIDEVRAFIAAEHAKRQQQL